MRHLSLALEPPGVAEVSDRSSVEGRVAALVADHFAFIWRLLRRSGLCPSDADDAAQQVFMTAAQKLALIRPGAERTFLYGTAVRVAANARRARRRRGVEAPLDDLHPSEAAPPDERAELGKAWALLDELLERMPEELARVLVLAEIEGLEVQEIAALEGIPLGTGSSRLRRAREQFHALLAGLGARRPFGGHHDD